MEEWNRLHPQWQKLSLKHGEPELRAKREDNLSSQLVEIQIRIAKSPPTTEQKASDVEGPKSAVRVLPTMSIRVFRLKLRKQLKLAPGRSTLRLWLVMGDGNLAEIQGNDSQELSWWGVSDHTEMVVLSEEDSP